MQPKNNKPDPCGECSLLGCGNLKNKKNQKEKNEQFYSLNKETINQKA